MAVKQPDPICTGCNKRPDEIGEYVTSAKWDGITPDEYVRTEEGTYNSKNGHFLCTDCYIAADYPSKPGRGRWVAP
jgi:hypothetical protein